MTLFKPYQPFITESLGAERAVELDPVSGTLTALQVLVLTGFLKEHDARIALAAYAALAHRED